MSETIADFAKRKRQLEALACPSTGYIPFFNRYIPTVTMPGSTYKHALEHVIRVRASGAD